MHRQHSLNADPLLLTASAGNAQVRAVEESLQGVAAQGEVAAAATATLQQQLAARDRDLARVQATLRDAEAQLSAATEQREESDRRTERCREFWIGFSTSTCDTCDVPNALPHRSGVMHQTSLVDIDLASRIHALFLRCAFHSTRRQCQWANMGEPEPMYNCCRSVLPTSLLQCTSHCNRCTIAPRIVNSARCGLQAAGRCRCTARRGK